MSLNLLAIPQHSWSMCICLLANICCDQHSTDRHTEPYTHPYRSLKARYMVATVQCPFLPLKLYCKPRVLPSCSSAKRTQSSCSSRPQRFNANCRALPVCDTAAETISVGPLETPLHKFQGQARMLPSSNPSRVRSFNPHSRSACRRLQCQWCQ